jgi:hypothetical protein
MQDHDFSVVQKQPLMERTSFRVLMLQFTGEASRCSLISNALICSMPVLLIPSPNVFRALFWSQFNKQGSACRVLLVEAVLVLICRSAG